MCMLDGKTGYRKTKIEDLDGFIPPQHHRNLVDDGRKAIRSAYCLCR